MIDKKWTHAPENTGKKRFRLILFFFIYKLNIHNNDNNNNKYTIYILATQFFVYYITEVL